VSQLKRLKCGISGTAKKEKIMFKKLAQSSENIVGYKVIGKLLDKDYKELIPVLEGLIEQHGKLRFLMDMTEYKGASIKAAMDDLMFDLKHDKEIERCAVVGNKTWEEWIVKISKVFMKGEIRYFDIHEIDQAWEWIKN
jgi:stage II sporulation SpoAA-like protein